MAEMFTCYQCGQEYEKDRDEWSEEAAHAEFKERFGVDVSEWPADDIAVVCDDCFNSAFVEAS